MAPGDSEAVAAPDAAATELAAEAESAVSEESVSGTVAPAVPVPTAPAAQSVPQHIEEPAHAAPADHNSNGVHPPASASLLESGQIRRAITIAQKRTDLNWSVFIGTLGSDPRVQAGARHAELGPAADKSVLIAVDPTAHHLEIVTGTHARKHLDDRSCALAVAAMTSSFAVRDLDGGIAHGILALVEHVRSVR